MASYIIRRLLLVFPTLLGITVVIFFVMALAPGGISAALISREGTLKPAERRAMENYLNERYGLKDPLYKQYFRWLNKVSPVGLKAVGVGFPKALPFGFKAPDLGESFVRRRPVVDLISDALPITVLLNLIAFPIVYVTSIITGIKAASKRGASFDVVTGTAFLALWSVPVTLTAVLAIGFLTSQQFPHLKWFPTNGLHDLLSGDMRFFPSYGPNGFARGYLLDTLWHLILPIICMCYADFAVLSKLCRGAVLENVMADYARTARAKGVSSKNILYRHVFHNSLLPLITVAAGILPSMLSGAVIIETIFGISGMGRLMVEAVFQKDFELVLSEALIAGILGLGGYLLTDILYAVADPRVKYD